MCTELRNDASNADLNAAGKGHGYKGGETPDTIIHVSRVVYQVFFENARWDCCLEFELACLKALLGGSTPKAPTHNFVLGFCSKII